MLVFKNVDFYTNFEKLSFVKTKTLIIQNAHEKKIYKTKRTIN